MNNKLYILICLISASVYGQDTTAVNKQNNLLNRIEAITGKEPNYKDTAALLKKQLYSVKETVKQQEQEINALNAELIEMQKMLLVSKYGQPGIWKAYGKEQFADFEKNKFLKNLNATSKGVHIYFAFEESTIDMEMYLAQLTELVDAWKKSGKSKFVLKAYSDSWGKSDVNTQLAKDRAEFVRQFLIKRFGIPTQSLVINFYGTSGTGQYTDPQLDFLNRQVNVILENE